MNGNHRWPDSSHDEADERGLFLAGHADRPPHGAVERGWAALSASIGLASVAGVTAVGSAASAAAASPIASASTVTAASLGEGSVVATATVAASKSTLGLALLPVAAKATILGFSIGAGMLGTAQVVERVRHHEGHGTAAAVASRTSRPPTDLRRSNKSLPSVRAVAQEVQVKPDSAATTSGHPVSSVTPTSTRVTPSSNEIGNEGQREYSLAEQAEELAHIKHLLDSGANHQALVRLQTSIATQSLSALAEDRDALHIEALRRTANLVEARRMAEAFGARYPHSPHRDRFRSLLESK